MVKPSNEWGQSLVELALVLPCFCLGIFMGVQLICYCHNMIELQRMAQVTIERQEVQFTPSVRDYWRFHGLWGRYSVQRLRSPDRLAAPSRPHRGLETRIQPGAILQMRVGSRLLPGAGFSRVLPPVTQMAFAQTYLEPSPRER